MCGISSWYWHKRLEIFPGVIENRYWGGFLVVLRNEYSGTILVTLCGRVSLLYKATMRLLSIYFHRRRYSSGLFDGWKFEVPATAPVTKMLP